MAPMDSRVVKRGSTSLLITQGGTLTVRGVGGQLGSGDDSGESGARVVVTGLYLSTTTRLLTLNPATCRAIHAAVSART